MFFASINSKEDILVRVCDTLKNLCYTVCEQAPGIYVHYVTLPLGGIVTEKQAVFMAAGFKSRVCMNRAVSQSVESSAWMSVNQHHLHPVLIHPPSRRKCS